MEKFLPDLNMPVLSALIKAEVTRAIKWNSFPGSVIHGVIGYKLKEHSCVVAHKNCQSCYLVHSCAYGMIYESPVPQGSKRMRLYPQVPHPIRVTVYPWHKPETAEGEIFEVCINLYGKTVTNFLLVLLSLDSAFQEGIGRKYRGERGTAKIKTLLDKISGNEKPWTELKQNYSSFIHPVSINSLQRATVKQEIDLLFKSPLKITTEGKPNFKPDVRDILATLLRRISNLSYFYNDKELDLDYTGILAKAESINVEKDLKRVKAIRYSSRQNKTISISGVTGKMTMKKCPPDLISLLEMGQYTGIGKSTTMGLGDYEVIFGI